MSRALTPQRFAAVLVVCLLLLAAALAVSPGIGTQRSLVGVADAWKAWAAGDQYSIAYRIGFGLRFPRAVKALVVGAVLALCGAVFQTLFRNPLATPYTLGIAGGASLGALIVFQTGWVVSVAYLSSVTIGAFVGAMAVLAVVTIMARSSARLSGNTLLLAGVTIGFFCSGMMMFVTYLADVRETFAIVRWMMGSLDTVFMSELAPILPIVIVVVVVLLAQANKLNQFEVGADIAASRGVRVERLQVVCILLGSLGVAAVVSLCGPIGFVGLIIPHLTRLFTGRDHRIVLPATALLGAVFLIGCDFLTSLVPAWYGHLAGRATTAAQLPIGVMTAIIGTPVFLVMLGWRFRNANAS